MTSNVASAIRPGLRDNRQPSSPHTPTRFISSSFSSPGSTFRQEEDAVVIELGTRYLRAGFEGESSPQCVIAFGPENSRRVGDYRFWTAGYQYNLGKAENWGKDYELFRNDVKDVDLGLLEDKLERAIREVYNKYLLTDAGTARLVLVLSSVVSRPVLSSILSTLFERWSYPTITLLPSPIMAAIAAGLRSALVVDIGWEETVVTSVYEYREISANRSTRAMRMLVQEMEQLLSATHLHHKDEGILPVNFAFVEEVVSRLAFCNPVRGSALDVDTLATQAGSISIASETTEHDGDTTSEPTSSVDVELDWPTPSSSRLIKVSSSALSQCIESVFLENKAAVQHLDDQESLLPQLVYKALLSLPPDARATCMARIVFVGGGSNIRGLSHRVLQDVDLLVKRYGWSAVRGKPVEKQRAMLAELSQGRTVPPIARHDVPIPPEKGNDAEAKLQKQQAKDTHQHLQGVLRQVDSLGSWAGASLLASLKIKGFVEIEQEKYLSHGLSGAQRDVETSVIPQRMSSFGLAAKASERSTWTLAGWG